MQSIRSTIIAIPLLLVLLLCPISTKAETVVGVAAYPFPPFLNDDLKTGLSVDFVEMLNAHQKKYRFKLDTTSPKRRYLYLSSGKVDMMLFEMPQWGWARENIDFETSKEIMTGGEVYITANILNRDQSYFKSIKDKSISAFFGYHYGFANFNSDREWLQTNFQIALLNSHDRIIELVMLNKVDIGVVTLSYLQKLIASYPSLNDKIIISKQFDQIYSLPALIKKNAPITVSQFEEILDELSRQGKLQALFKKFGLEKQLTYTH